MNQKLFLYVSLLFICASLLMAPAGWGDEPQPGTVINSTNIDQYKDYFPPHMARYIKDGWGFEKPVVIHVKATDICPPLPQFMEETKKNDRKCRLTPDGLLEGYSGSGQPFLNPKEPNKALKIMWNQYYKPTPDDWIIPESYMQFAKRADEKNVSISRSVYNSLRFSGRTMLDPRPELPHNPFKLFWASIYSSRTAPFKDMATLTWRYKDPLKNDDMWTYVPTLRRTIRMVSSERANPINGTPYTWDGYFGFDGKIPLFSYKLLKEQKVLALVNQKTDADDLPKGGWRHPVYFAPTDPYELVDSYLIEIKSKDTRYPSARRNVWIMKFNYWITYAEVFDKSDSFWKGYNQTFQVRPLLNDQPFAVPIFSGITDFKTLYWVDAFVGKLDINMSPHFSIFDPGSLGSF